MPSRGNKVAYIYDQDIGDFEFEHGHVMKPHRIRMTNDIVREYGLYSHMHIYRPERATPREMTQFHTDEYIQYLQKLTPETVELFPRAQAVHELEEDCPVFEGLFDFCRISAGGSMDGARILGDGTHDIAINWAGGLHHAKKNMASGFCYVNDIVLAILDLLRKFKRVLYIDIDVHHGDGVEEAFYTTDRVMTASFHKFGGFPGTGHILDTGINNGMNYAVNVPLRDNIDDESYRSMFEPIIGTIMECYRPEAIVLQCGADSLSGDHIGAFNLSMKGHANCVKFVKSFNIPLLVLGGGGYTVPNVAKTWAYETGICVGVELDPVIPKKLELVTDYDQSDPPKWQGWKKDLDYYNNFAPNYELDVRASNRLNHNSKQYLDKIRTIIIENIRRTKIPVPSVQMTDVPADTENLESALRDADENEFPDERYTLYRADKHIMEQDAELPDTDDESDYPMMRKSKPSKCGSRRYDEEKAGGALAEFSTANVLSYTQHSDKTSNSIAAAAKIEAIQRAINEVVENSAAPAKIEAGEANLQFSSSKSPDVKDPSQKVVENIEVPPKVLQKKTSFEEKISRYSLSLMGKNDTAPQKSSYISPYGPASPGTNPTTYSPAGYFAPYAPMWTSGGNINPPSRSPTPVEKEKSVSTAQVSFPQESKYMSPYTFPTQHPNETENQNIDPTFTDNIHTTCFPAPVPLRPSPAPQPEAKYISPYSTYKSGAESDEQYRVWLENVERDTAAKLLRNQEMSVGRSIRGMGGFSLSESDEQYRVWLENVERDTKAQLLRNQEISVGMSIRGMGGVSLAERIRGEKVRAEVVKGENMRGERGGSGEMGGFGRPPV